MISVKKKNEAFEILKKYNGDNPYILKLKKSVYELKNINAIGDLQAEFILKNKDTSPKEINKIVKIADWWGESKKTPWGMESIPEIIKVISYLGETETCYVCTIQYRQSIPPSIHILPKKAILTNFLVEDYTKMEIDFDRYDRLSNYQRILLDHQKTAVKFLLSRKKCMLADDPGLGKTTSLAVAAIEGNFDSVLIICPANVKTTWKRELKMYIPEKDITIIENPSTMNKSELEEFLNYPIGKSKRTKNELLEEAKEHGQWKHNRFIIVNYDILDNFFSNKRTYTQEQFEDLVSQNPMLEYINNRKSLIIIDEAHVLSNYKTLQYKTIKGLITKGKPHSIFLATGTPITNNPANLYPVLDLLEDSITGDWEYYMKRYCNAEEFCRDRETRDKWANIFIKKKGKSKWHDLTKEEKKELDEYLHKIRPKLYVLAIKGDSNLKELKSRISHIYLKRKNTILQLPEKEIHKMDYTLTKEQRDEYSRLWEEYVKEKTKDAEKSEEDINKSLLEGAVYRQYLSKEMIPHTIELTNKFIEKNEKVVIACCYDEELYSLKEHYGDKCVIFNGKMTSKQKDEAINQFINNDEVMVFVGNIKAAGVGITLIKSHILIFNDFDYVPGNNRQMSDRVYRIGQNHKVDIFYQIFNDTQYEKMWDINESKQLVINQIIKAEKNGK